MMEVSRNLRQANKLPVPRLLLIRLVRFSRFPLSPSVFVRCPSLARSLDPFRSFRPPFRSFSKHSIDLACCSLSPSKEAPMSRTKRWNASHCFFLLLLSKEWRAFLSACLSHLDLLSQNDERGRYSVMGQFPDQLRCNKQISNGPRGQGRAHRAVVMIWTDEPPPAEDLQCQARLARLCRALSIVRL